VESTGEFAWFRAQVLQSIVRPRAFARSLAREHFGLAGVLVVLAAGIALSLTIDLVVLATKDISPAEWGSRLFFGALLLGARLAVSVAVVSLVVFLGGRAMRQANLTLDQSFNAVSFALAPLILAPVVALLPVFESSLLLIAGVVLAVIALRALAALAFNLRAILPLPVAALALVLALVSGAFTLSDQVARVRMTAYAIAPELAPPLSATPAQGKRYDFPGGALTVPDEWTYSSRGVPGEVAHFETPKATLNVVVSHADDLATMAAFADQVARGERVGFSAKRDERVVERIDGRVAVEDRADGTYEARRIVLHQFAILLGANGMALQFRFFDAPDVDAAFAQAAAIAATWQVRTP
jgi:hypothetical protein